MAEAVGAVPVAESKGPGLFSRLAGVLFSPKATYAAVVARPRALGALLVTIVIMSAAQGLFFATPVGQEVLIDQQVRAMEAFGVNITDEMYAQLESRVAYAPYTTAGSLLVFFPLFYAIIAGIVLAIFGMLMGGTGTFKQVFAILAHAGVITALQTLFAMPLSYATQRLAGATLDVFVPGVEETSFLARFLGGIDLFWMWWCVSIAIGVGVLFKRRTGGIAMTFLSIYVVVVLAYALIRAGS
ncbi:MAG TPA: YIP1 family protein [Vicinamibacterales bacterium]|nr:YIP1 family protein [Vicinamibacterales bacterium]